MCIARKPLPQQENGRGQVYRAGCACVKLYARGSDGERGLPGPSPPDRLCAPEEPNEAMEPQSPRSHQLEQDTGPSTGTLRTNATNLVQGLALSYEHRADRHLRIKWRRVLESGGGGGTRAGRRGGRVPRAGVEGGAGGSGGDVAGGVGGVKGSRAVPHRGAPVGEPLEPFLVENVVGLMLPETPWLSGEDEVVALVEQRNTLWSPDRLRAVVASEGFETLGLPEGVERVTLEGLDDRIARVEPGGLPGGWTLRRVESSEEVRERDDDGRSRLAGARMRLRVLEAWANPDGLRHPHGSVHERSGGR